MDKILTNTNDNSVIDQKRIISNTDKGIVTSNKKCWYFVPKDKINEENEYEDGYYFTSDSQISKQKADSTAKFYTKENEVESNYTEKARYYFGIKDIQLFNSQEKRVSGIISDYLNLNQNYAYISIYSIENNGQDYSVEYSILDGINEIPILPENITTAVKEKLFYNTSLRFNINTTTEPILYEDNIELNKSYLELSYEDFENHEYTLTYNTLGDNNKYIPANNNIKVKVIIRKIGDNFISPEISLGINKYGGEEAWN